MEMMRPKASVSRVARRPWASLSASRATRTKAIVLKTAKPAHMNRIGLTSPLPEMASMMRPNRIGSAIVIAAKNNVGNDHQGYAELVSAKIAQSSCIDLE